MEKNNKSTKQLITVIIVAILAIVLLYFGYNGIQILSGKARISSNLPGKTYNWVLYTHDLELYDRENNLSYTFYGAKSDFVFNNDKTVTWTKQYKRSSSTAEYYTDPITETHSYTIKYTGGLIYDATAFYIKLDTGDLLTLKLDLRDPDAKKNLNPSEVNYSPLHDENLVASPLLKNMDTGLKITGTLPEYKGTPCNHCGGDGKTHDWNPSEYAGTECDMCNGTGYIPREEK